MARGERPRPQRSAEERERDRFERERRRAGEWDVEDESPPAFADGELRLPPEPLDDAPLQHPVEPLDDAPLQRPVEPLDDAPLQDPIEPREDAPLQHPVEPLEDDPRAGAPLEDDPRRPLPSLEDDPRPALADDPRRPPPVGDEPRRRSFARRRPAGVASRRRSVRARLGALAALALAIFAVWFLVSLFQPFHGSGSGSVIVEIPKGASASKVGSILEADGVVSSGFFFELRALLDGKRSSLHSGRFQLRRGMSYAAAITALSQPPPAAIVVKVVIPEGYTRAQIAQLAASDSLTGSYLAASARSRELRPSHYGAPAGTASLEGFLFPATYELVAGSPAGRLVSAQLIAFKERYGASLFRAARALSETPYELLVVASMIEREAQVAADRPRVAAVIYNRLRAGMPLGIDATIYYAIEQQTGKPTYTGELTASQLRIESPYNTRTHKGLPPTPIANPGEASIAAAEHPARASYLYYVLGADGCGEHVFSSTYARFREDAAAYERALAQGGGHLPACKQKP